MLLKRIALALTVIALQGCGFQPLYSGDPTNRQNIVLHFKGDGAPAYKFRRELEKHLAIVPHFDSHKYVVDVNLSSTKTGATYSDDATINRTTTSLMASYTVKRDDHLVGKNTSEISSSYPILNKDNFNTINAELDVDQRTAITLAEDVARDLLRIMHAGNLS